jgi:hypothetical protein
MVMCLRAGWLLFFRSEFALMIWGMRQLDGSASFCGNRRGWFGEARHLFEQLEKALSTDKTRQSLFRTHIHSIWSPKKRSLS